MTTPNDDVRPHANLLSQHAQWVREQVTIPTMRALLQRGLHEGLDVLDHGLGDASALAEPAVAPPPLFAEACVYVLAGHDAHAVAQPGGQPIVTGMSPEALTGNESDEVRRKRLRRLATLHSVMERMQEDASSALPERRDTLALELRLARDVVAAKHAELIDAANIARVKFEHQFATLRRVIDAGTLPAEGGARRVGGLAAAVGISEAVQPIHVTLGELLEAQRVLHGSPAATMEHALPDAPAVIIEDPKPAAEQPAAVLVESMKIGREGIDAPLFAAMEAVWRVTMFPPDKWNKMQSRRPGAQHHRYHDGDLFTADDIARLDSAAKMLGLAGSGDTTEPPFSLSKQAGDSDFKLTQSAVEDEVAPTPALTKNDLRVFIALSTFDGSRLLSAEDIADALDAGDRLSDKTIRKSVTRLIRYGFAERPQGDRQGARLTTRGRMRLAKIAA